VDIPFLPYFLSKKSLEFSTIDKITEEKINVKLLSDLRKHTVWKYTVPSSDYIAQINKSLNKGGLDRHQKVVNAVFENHIPYIHRILLDQPDFFTQFENDQPLTTMAMDIETLRFQYQDKKTIISIAYSFFDGEKWQEIQSNQSEEKEILEWFLSAVETLDPSIITGYFHRQFDFPRIISRCKVHKLDYHRLGREHGTKTWVNRRFNETNTIIPGRILYDILDSVLTDQTLFGLRNKKMKTVCEHFGIEGDGWTKEPMAADTANIPIDVLRNHNIDDIRRTTNLWEIYWGNVQEQAEMFNIPLSLVAEGKSQTLIADISLDVVLNNRISTLMAIIVTDIPKSLTDHVKKVSEHTKLP
jgi:DNA polymerase elongation subunit (family B)